MQSSRENTYIRAYVLLILIIVGAAGFYGYKMWTDYDFLKQGFSKNEAAAEALKTLETDEQSTYEEKKPEFKDFTDMVNKNIIAIFPSDEQYTTLTKKMDDIEAQLSTPSNPIEISNITFQKPVKIEGYSLLPLRMTVKSSQPNFLKFLKLIESSGSVDSELRLMDIPSIRLNFEDIISPEGKDNKVLDFTVQLNAYFQ